VRCFYVNGNKEDDGTQPCVETDFAFRLTAHQPISWAASTGLPNLPLAGVPGPTGQFNSGRIPPVPQDPILAELKCVEVGDDELPVQANDLKGEATIETITAAQQEVPVVDSRGYNAIGIQASGPNDGDNTLVIGGATAEYNACPAVLLVDHFFDGAEEPSAAEDTVTSRVTLVACSEDFLTQTQVTSTVQFLVYNEFEQRFSTSRKATCITDFGLSDIDTRPGTNDDAQSIFNVAVEGTLTGQTIMRGVDDRSPNHGNGILAIAEEFHSSGERVHSAAFAAHQRGTRTDPDSVLLPIAGVPDPTPVPTPVP